MDTRFEQGDVLRCTTAAQGLAQGQLYRVAEVQAQATPWGTYVTYVVEDAKGAQRAVLNGHLLLEPAGVPEEGPRSASGQAVEATRAAQAPKRAARATKAAEPGPVVGGATDRAAGSPPAGDTFDWPTEPKQTKALRVRCEHTDGAGKVHTAVAVASAKDGHCPVDESKRVVQRLGLGAALEAARNADGASPWVTLAAKGLSCKGPRSWHYWMQWNVRSGQVRFSRAHRD
jgi:hypothetical protein